MKKWLHKQEYSICLEYEIPCSQSSLQASHPTSNDVWEASILQARGTDVRINTLHLGPRGATPVKRAAYLS